MSTGSPSTQPVETWSPTDETDLEPDVPWIVLVWNDPINLMSYVTFVFQKLFGYSLEKATSLMLDVHEKGGPSCRRGRGRRPSSTCSDCTSTACGPRCSRTSDLLLRRRRAVIVRRPDGSFNLALTPDERALLAGLADQLEDLVDAGPDDPLARRLFPVAYPDDEKREAEYRLLAGEELRASRRAALERCARPRKPPS